MSYSVPSKIITTVLGAEIIREAEGWLNKNCKEIGDNSGECIISLKDEYDRIDVPRSALYAEPYCAQTTTVFFANALAKFGKQSPVITAGALDFKNKAKKAGILVDKNPVAGSIFYKPSSAGTGHVGLVWNVDKDYIYTIEGNATVYLFDGDGFSSKTIEGLGSLKRKRKSSFDYIHVEQYGNLNQTIAINAQYSGTGMSLAGGMGIGILAVSFALGGYFYNKRK